MPIFFTHQYRWHFRFTSSYVIIHYIEVRVCSKDDFVPHMSRMMSVSHVTSYVNRLGLRIHWQFHVCMHGSWNTVSWKKAVLGLLKFSYTALLQKVIRMFAWKHAHTKKEVMTVFHAEALSTCSCCFLGLCTTVFSLWLWVFGQEECYLWADCGIPLQKCAIHRNDLVNVAAELQYMKFLAY